MLENITLHPATTADIDMMVDMRMQFGAALGHQPNAEQEQDIRKHLHDYYTDELGKGCICWYAAHNGTPVSIIVMILRRQPGSPRHPSGKWGYLMNVFTLPAYQRRGISTLLLGKITEHAISLGYTAFELHATKDGEPMYTKEGFKMHTEPTYRKFAQ